VTATIDVLLRQARRSLARLAPHEAFAAIKDGALLVDIRPQVNRDCEGELPGALVIDRNVLEWRLDPSSDARLAIASYELFPIVVCNEGYASSFAAVSLQELGMTRATDLVGGYRAWRAAGLPVREPVASVGGGGDEVRDRGGVLQVGQVRGRGQHVH
jgi:rhodanese-related sulfurtransferase